MKPNVILFNIDDMGYCDLGCYGSEVNKTPTIDRLAEEGIRCTDFYAAAPVCTPARAGLLTGCYPKRIGFGEFQFYPRENSSQASRTTGVLFPGQPEGLHKDEKTLGNLFKESGYVTKMIGKWHLGDQPEHSPLMFGFDEYFGLPYSNDMGMMDTKNYSQQVEDSMCPLPLIKNNDVIQEQPDCQALAERYTTEAINFIEKNKKDPFFLYFAHYYVHDPLYVADTFMENSSNGKLGGAMASIDWTVKSILFRLEQLDIADDTMIVFMADNGGALKSSNYPLSGYKGSTLEGGQRVNCIIYWKNMIKKGRVCSDIISMTDFYATFAEMLGLNIEDEVIRDSISIYNLIENESEHSKRNIFYYYNQNELQAVRKDRYKLNIISKQLYDLHEDIGESQNIYEQNSEIVHELELLIHTMRKDIGDSFTNTEGTNCREKSYVKLFKPLTVFNPEHPYIVSMYD